MNWMILEKDAMSKFRLMNSYFNRVLGYPTKDGKTLCYADEQNPFIKPKGNGEIAFPIAKWAEEYLPGAPFRYPIFSTEILEQKGWFPNDFHRRGSEEVKLARATVRRKKYRRLAITLIGAAAAAAAGAVWYFS